MGMKRSEKRVLVVNSRRESVLNELELGLHRAGFKNVVVNKSLYTARAVMRTMKVSGDLAITLTPKGETTCQIDIQATASIDNIWAGFQDPNHKMVDALLKHLAISNHPDHVPVLVTGVEETSEFEVADDLEYEPQDDGYSSTSPDFEDQGNSRRKTLWMASAAVVAGCVAAGAYAYVGSRSFALSTWEQMESGDLHSEYRRAFATGSMAILQCLREDDASACEKADPILGDALAMGDILCSRDHLDDACRTNANLKQNLEMANNARALAGTVAAESQDLLSYEPRR